MNIIFCYVNVPVASAGDAIRKYAPNAEWIDTSGTIYDYNEAIASHWTGKDDLLVIEGDKEIHAEVIPSMGACNELWCAYSYYNYPEPYHKKEIYGLGCTKYSAELQRQISTSEFCCPDPNWERVCMLCDGKGCWRFLDTRITIQILTKCISFAPHIHGMINHHHDYPDDWAYLRGLK